MFNNGVVKFDINIHPGKPESQAAVVTFK